MGYICSGCGEALPEDTPCPSCDYVIDEESGDEECDR